MSTTNVLPAAVEQEQRAAVRRVPKATLIVRRFCRNKAAVAGFAIFVLLALLAVIGPFVAQWQYDDLSR